MIANFYKKYSRHDSMTSILKECSKEDNWGISGDIVKSKFNAIIDLMKYDPN